VRDFYFAATSLVKTHSVLLYYYRQRWHCWTVFFVCDR